MQTLAVPVYLDLIGVFFFAVSGSLLAARQRFDLIGSLLLASVAGLGGGVIRDVIMNRPLPTAFAEPIYLLPPLLAVIVVYVISPAIRRFNRLLILFDAGGLALFCVTGTLIALNFELNPISAVLLGVTTAVGGGLARDVIANVTPAIFDQREFYAVPAFIGAGLTVGFDALNWLNPFTVVAIVVLVFALRVAGRRWRWGVPLAARHETD